MPHDYKRALREMEEAEQAMKAGGVDRRTEVVGAPATGTRGNS